MPIVSALTVSKLTTYTMIGMEIDFQAKSLTAKYLINIDGLDRNEIDITYTGVDWDFFFADVVDPVTLVVTKPIGARFTKQVEIDLAKKNKISGSVV